MAVSGSTIRLLLVEDDFDVAASLAAYLEPRGIRIDFAYSVAEAIDLALQARFDIALVDVQLPDGDGVGLCSELKRRGFASPVVFLTARGALDDRLRGFEAGGIDYVVKPFEPAELLARIRGIVAQISAAPQAMTLQAAGYALDLRTGALSRDATNLALGATHFRIMRALIEAYPGTLPRDTLTGLLWDDEVPPSDPLRMHVHHLRRLLDKTFGAPLIATVRGLGYRFGG